MVLPILFEGSVLAVIELASFAAFSPTHQSLLEQLTESIGLVLNTVDATSMTERLLEQSRSQAQELQSRQEELRKSNEDLAEQATLLADKNSEVEAKYQEIEEAKRLVEETAIELSVSSKYKSEFIANMSHELRTPLNSLLVLAEQLADNPDGNLTDRQVQYATTIHSSGVDLLKLLNDILDLAKVESNTIQLEISALPLATLRDNLAQSFQPVAEAQGLTFSIDLDSDLPETIDTDPHRLRQILKNLLANAFKFTREGGVAVRLKHSPDGWDRTNEALRSAHAVLAISVTDTGIGIREEQQASMFEAFAQGDGSTSREYGGTGLGLSISRNLSKLLGGEIGLTSEPGEGSTFTLYLPLEAPLAAATELPQPFPLLVSDIAQLLPGTRAAIALPQLGERVDKAAFYSGAAAGATVLIVDDDMRNLFAMTALLERGKLQVVTAESGAAALLTLEQRSDVDIVLMDIMMPLMDGYDTIAAIRERPEHADLPIIAVTGKVVGRERERCLAAGASDYIPKPVDTDELLAAISVWLPVAALGDKPDESVAL
jgi:signal transduction histidine kinase/ActR/RegA family two-component response regulator